MTDAIELEDLYHERLRQSIGERLYIGFLKFTGSYPDPTSVYEYFKSIGAPATCIYVTFGNYDIIFRSWMHEAVFNSFMKTIDLKEFPIQIPNGKRIVGSIPNVKLAMRPLISAVQGTHFLWTSAARRKAKPADPDIAFAANELRVCDPKDGLPDEIVKEFRRRGILLTRKSRKSFDGNVVKYFVLTPATPSSKSFSWLTDNLKRISTAKRGARKVENVSIYSLGSNIPVFGDQEYTNIIEDMLAYNPEEFKIFSGSLIKFEHDNPGLAEQFIVRFVYELIEGLSPDEQDISSVSTTTLSCFSEDIQVLRDDPPEIIPGGVLEAQKTAFRFDVNPVVWASADPTLQVKSRELMGHVDDKVRNLGLEETPMRQRLRRTLVEIYLSNEPRKLIYAIAFLVELERDFRTVAMGSITKLTKASNANWLGVLDYLISRSNLGEVAPDISSRFRRYNSERRPHARWFSLRDSVDVLNVLDRGMAAIDKEAELGRAFPKGRMKEKVIAEFEAALKESSGSTNKMLGTKWYEAAQKAVELRNDLAHGHFSRDQLDLPVYIGIVDSIFESWALYMRFNYHFGRE